MDTSASCHICCYDRGLFKCYSEAEDGRVLLVDSHSTHITEVGGVELKFISGKTVILKEVLHVPEIRKNLVSGYLINKAGFTQQLGLTCIISQRMVPLLKKGMLQMECSN